ncbi:phosphatase PAP2 family protein [Actinacidiphila oryziradicis]|uniref:Phosphatase PAP2 family protein n=1 Tax=Actinacidiphila oryziradicis TaxID=2571141 RepID=A0A4V5N030_9ACTN|nr:phosphatase PAP2 family protein [Actinacidiphila oryziradicis]TKA10179.1 phosphatase PAP2 family protein [Actinacidiphila oryziradicis]
MPYVRHWLRNSLLVFAFAIVLGLIAAHTHLTQPHELLWDRDLQTSTRTGWLNTLMLGVSDIFSPVGGLVIIALWCGWLLFARHKPVTAVSTFLVIAVGWNSSEIAKIIVARNRPPAVYSLAPETGSNSFPSGHVALTVSLAVAAYFLARGTRHQRTVAVGGAAVVLLVAFSRLYIGAHYPTDVLGSLLVSGAAITFLTGAWDRWLLSRLHLVPLLARFGSVPGPEGRAEPVEPAAERSGRADVRTTTTAE